MENSRMKKPADAIPSTAILQSLPQPIIVCAEDRQIIFVNYANSLNH